MAPNHGHCFLFQCLEGWISSTIVGQGFYDDTVCHFPPTGICGPPAGGCYTYSLYHTTDQHVRSSGLHHCLSDCMGWWDSLSDPVRNPNVTVYSCSSAPSVLGSILTMRYANPPINIDRDGFCCVGRLARMKAYGKANRSIALQVCSLLAKYE